jgi:hypothetical protein
MEKKDYETSWKALYKIAGIMALLIVLVGLADIALSMMGGETRSNSAIAVTEWFSLFQSNRIAALSNLGLINIITLSLGIPIYLAMFGIHRHSNPAFAGLAAILFFMGAAIYISSNSVFSVLALSTQYAVATEAQKPLLEAAGRAALAQGADLTPGTFMGLFFAQIGGFIMAMVILRGGLFGKWTAWFGLFGFGCMILFFPLAAFAPEQFTIAMLISMFGGLALMVYHILLARRLFQSGAATI